MLIVYLTIAWFAGIWLVSWLGWDTAVWLSLALVGLIGGALLRQRRPFGLLLICLGVLGLGSIRFIVALPDLGEGHISYYNDLRRVTVSGLVVDEPDARDRWVNLRIAAEEVMLADGTAVPVSGLIQVKTFRFPIVQYGTRLMLDGRLETPPQGEEFDYKAYLARQGVHSLMALPQMEIVAEGEGNPIYRMIFAFKARAQVTINQLFPDPQAALLTGILLGNDNGIPPDLAEDFRVTGMSHIIAISGFNIAILIAILVSVSEPLLGRRGAAVFAIVGIAFYTILVGADASVVRAAVMGTIYLMTNRWLGRPNFAYASLFAAGFLMTLLDPHTLWNIGFQLSFMATLGLMLYADPFTHWTQRQLLRIMNWKATRQVMNVLSEAVVITLAAQVLTLPLIIGYFRQLSLVSLPANALILPAQPAVMIWGGAATLVGMIAPSVGQLLAWVAWLPLTYTIGLVRMFAAVPYAAVPVEVGWGFVVGLYFLIGIVTWLAKQEQEQRTQILAALRQNGGWRVAFTGSLAGALLIFSWGNSQPDGKLHITFMNVGQGDATFIQTPSGRQILVDGGFYPSVLNDQLGQQMPFWDKEIDLMVATHPDADHVSGLVGVFERYRVGQLITDGEGLGESPIYDAVLLAAEVQGTSVHRAMAGERIEIGDGVRLEVLHPGAELDQESRNENSVSMRLVYGDFTFLFTGDAEEKAEEVMLANGRPLQSLVFKAGHHGSRSSSTMPFLEAVQPQIIVVSAGADNNFGHPHPEMLARAQDIGATVLRTDELATIELTTDGQVMWWRARP
ncbi:MAG: DNA internalization-related competence protein ComEC/Rec2 [Chloroflexi bacterium]|nr:DNA internalization-related competence protein ComEC/Rec2 [Chloroflexota bacterium]